MIVCYKYSIFVEACKTFYLEDRGEKRSIKRQVIYIHCVESESLYKYDLFAYYIFCKNIKEI